VIERSTECDHGGWLLRIGVIVLAMLLQGMVLWRFLSIDIISGSRGFLVGAVVVIIHVFVALRFKPVYSRRVIPPICALTVAVLVLVFSLARQIPTEYGVWKVQGFILFAYMPSVLILWNLTGRHIFIRFFLTWMLVFSFAPLLLPLLIINEMGTGPLRWILTTIDIDIIGIGRIMGIGCLLAFIAAVGKRKLLASLLAIGGLLLLAAQVLAGERGPLLALVAGLTAFGLAHGRDSRHDNIRHRMVILTIAVILAVSAMAYLFIGRAQSGYEEK